MRLLFLEASPAPARAAIGVVRASDVAVEREAVGDPNAGARSGDQLPALVREVLAAASAPIDRIVVSVGPAGFTGVRIAVAFARGLGLARSVPVVGVDALAALARQLRTASDPIGLIFGTPTRPLWRVASADAAARGAPSRPESLRSDQPVWTAAPLWCGPAAALVAGADASAPVDLVFGPERPTVPSYLALGAIADPATPATPFYGRPPDAAPPSRGPVARIGA